MNDGEKIWEYCGAQDPYFGVNTIREMRSDVISEND